MKNSKNLMLLLAAGAAYWYFAVYLKKKSAGLPAYSDVKVQENLNAPNVPTIIPAETRLRPLAYQPDVVSENNDVYNVKYTLSGYKKLGRVPNTI